MYHFLVNGTEFKVEAESLQEAMDAVVDYLMLIGVKGFYKTNSDLLAECDMFETVEDRILARRLTKCGTHGVYVKIERIENNG